MKESQGRECNTAMGHSLALAVLASPWPPLGSGVAVAAIRINGIRITLPSLEDCSGSLTG